MDKVWEAVIMTVICGLGPVWDDFMKEVNLRVGLGLWQTWQRFQLEPWPKNGEGEIVCAWSRVELTKEVGWILQSDEASHSDWALSLASSVLHPGAATVNRHSPPAFKEPTVSRERQALKQLNSACVVSAVVEKVAFQTRATCCSLRDQRGLPKGDDAGAESECMKRN